MSLDEALGLGPASPVDERDRLCSMYGLTKNPFPPAGQPSGHPHLETAADKILEDAIKSFRRDGLSQVVVVEGEQGVGKTNILAYYNSELRRFVAAKRIDHYIVRYYSDPEPSFEAVLNTLLQQIGAPVIREIVERYGRAEEPLRREVQEAIRNQDVWAAILSLSRAPQEILDEEVAICMEWISGHRLLKRHRENLNVTYRLDTVEAKTQALRDLIEAGHILGALQGVVLLLDELEKQDFTTSKTNVVRFLLSIRALIDALPRHLFLLVALTPVAKTRYFQMVPSVQSRMQRVVTLKSFRTWDEAKSLYRFYLEKGREAARTEFPNLKAGTEDIVTADAAAACFDKRLAMSRRIGAEGVSPRDFLDELHQSAAAKMEDALA